MRTRLFRFSVFLFFVLVLFCIFNSYSGVTCTVFQDPDGNTAYIECTGWGHSGGSGSDPSGGGGGTNCWGACTNCVQMSPQEMHDFKIGVDGELGVVEDRLNIVRTGVSNSIEVVSRIVHAPDGLQYYTGLHSSIAAKTNFINNVINNVPSDNLVKQAYDNAVSKINSNQPAARSSAQVGSWNGALAYAQSASSYLDNEVLTTLDSTMTGVNSAFNAVDTVRSHIQSLPETPCRGGEGTGGDGGGSGGTCDNPDYGEWCTEEQGDAIIELLESLDDWADKKIRYLTYLTNYVSSVERNLKNGLFSDYTHIPKYLYSGQDVGSGPSLSNKNWRTFYLSGGQDEGVVDFGYNPTNVLERIELLLFGIAGLGDDDDTTAIPESDVFDSGTSFTNAVDSSVSYLTDLGNDFNREEKLARANTVIRSARRFFSAFTPLNSRVNLDSSTRFTPEYRISLNGGQEFVVPSLTVSEQAASYYNTFRDAIHDVFAVVWIILCSWLIFGYWSWVGKYMIKFTKWGTELLNSLFGK